MEWLLAKFTPSKIYISNLLSSVIKFKWDKMYHSVLLQCTRYLKELPKFSHKGVNRMFRFPVWSRF